MNAKQIKEARDKAGLSQTELAEKLGTRQGIVSAWERGIDDPTEGQQKKLVEVFGNHYSGDVADTSPLAAWLTKARIAKNLSVAELAHIANVTPPAIYRIEQGLTRNLQEKTRKKLEEALDNKLPDEAAKEVAQESQVVGLGKFEDFDPHSDADRPTGPGIYVLYDISDRPVYVGKSGNVRNRIVNHADKFWFKDPIVYSASWIHVKDEKLRTQIEELLIKFLKSHAIINKTFVERED